MPQSNKGEREKVVAKNTIILYFRLLFTMAVSLYTSRVVLNVLGVDDFGIYNVVAGFISMFAILTSSLVWWYISSSTFVLGVFLSLQYFN